MEEVIIKLTKQEVDYLAHDFATKTSGYSKNSGKADIERMRMLEEEIIKSIYDKMCAEEETWEDRETGWGAM